MTTLSRELADWAVSLKHDDIPSNVIESAKTAFPDVAGIALTSSGMKFGRDAVALARDLGTGGEASVLGFDLRLPVPNAALAVPGGRESISDVSGLMSLRRPA